MFAGLSQLVSFAIVFVVVTLNSVDQFLVAQSFDLDAANQGWKSFQRRLTHGVSCRETDLFEKKENAKEDWRVDSEKAAVVSFCGEKRQKSMSFESVVADQNPVAIKCLNESYFFEVKRTKNRFSLVDCTGREQYPFHPNRPGYPYLRACLFFFQGSEIESVQLSDLLSNPQVTWHVLEIRGQGEDQEIEIEYDSNLLEVDEYNRLSTGRFVLLPGKNWLLKHYESMGSSIVNLEDVINGKPKKWSVPVKSVFDATYTNINGEWWPEKYVTTYQTDLYGWRRYTSEFSEYRFDPDPDSFYTSYYGLPEPPFVKPKRAWWFWPGVVVGVGTVLFLIRTFIKRRTREAT